MMTCSHGRHEYESGEIRRCGEGVVKCCEVVPSNERHTDRFNLATSHGTSSTASSRFYQVPVSGPYIRANGGKVGTVWNKSTERASSVNDRNVFHVVFHTPVRSDVHLLYVRISCCKVNPVTVITLQS